MMLTYNHEINEYQNASIMMIDWAWIKEWFLSLGTEYNVNPWLFGGIYLGAIPFFTVSLGWLIKRIKKKESIVLPALSTGFFFISAYLYLIIAGKNVPIWVYIFVVLMIFYGLYSTINKIKKEVVENE
jgi:hypothetical protein